MCYINGYLCFYFASMIKISWVCADYLLFRSYSKSPSENYSIHMLWFKYYFYLEIKSVFRKEQVLVCFNLENKKYEKKTQKDINT